MRMALRPHLIGPVPAEIARIAQAAFRKGNLYMTLRSELESLYTDEDFADLLPTVIQQNNPGF
jgi:transposase